MTVRTGKLLPPSPALTSAPHHLWKLCHRNSKLTLTKIKFTAEIHALHFPAGMEGLDHGLVPDNTSCIPAPQVIRDVA